MRKYYNLDVGELVVRNPMPLERVASLPRSVEYLAVVSVSHGAIVSCVRGMAETLSAYETSMIDNGVVFQDGSVIVVENWSTDGMQLLVMGHSAFDILEDDDKRIIFGTVSGFRYHVVRSAQHLHYFKQPIAP